MRAIDSLGQQQLKGKILKAVAMFGERTKPYASFKEFREDSSSQTVPCGENSTRRSGVLAVAKTAANQMTRRRRARILRNVVQQLPPDLLLAKVLETLARLPPESFTGLTFNLSNLLWDLLVKRAGPRNAAAMATGVSSGAGVATGAVIGAANKGTFLFGILHAKGAVVGTSALTATALASLPQGQAATKALAESFTSSTSDVLDTLTSSLQYDGSDTSAREMVLNNLAQVFPPQVAIEVMGAAALMGLGVYFLSSKRAWGSLSALGNLDDRMWLGEKSGDEICRRLLIELSRTSPSCARVLSQHTNSSSDWTPVLFEPASRKEQEHASQQTKRKDTAAVTWRSKLSMNLRMRHKQENR